MGSWDYKEIYKDLVYFELHNLIHSKLKSLITVVEKAFWKPRDFTTEMIKLFNQEPFCMDKGSQIWNTLCQLPDYQGSCSFLMLIIVFCHFLFVFIQ